MNEFGAHPEWQASECLTDKHEHTRCTDLPHNSLSPHWAHSPIGPSSTSTGTEGQGVLPLTCWVLLLLITFLTVTGTTTLHCITQVLSQSIMFQVKEITHSTIVALKAYMLGFWCKSAIDMTHNTRVYPDAKDISFLYYGTVVRWWY